MGEIEARNIPMKDMTVPCVLASRADSVDTKLNSIAEAVMFVNK